jgi:hypothetical protein
MQEEHLIYDVHINHACADNVQDAGSCTWAVLSGGAVMSNISLKPAIKDEEREIQPEIVRRPRRDGLR